MTHEFVPTDDRPARETKPEIEITPEMIEAGVAELRLLEANESFYSLVECIYRAMMQVKSV